MTGMCVFAIVCAFISATIFGMVLGLLLATYGGHG